MTLPRILVAGVGNIFLGDDAFGVEVVRRLASGPLPPGTVVRDFGVRGFDLACALQDGYDAVVLVDATRRGGPAGSLYVIEPQCGPTSATSAHTEALQPHALTPAEVFRLVQAMGGRLPPLRLVGCEPATFGADREGEVGLSEPVREAVGGAVRLVVAVVEELRQRFLAPA